MTARLYQADDPKDDRQRMNHSEAFAFRIDPEGIQRMTGDGSERLRASMISRLYQADDPEDDRRASTSGLAAPKGSGGTNRRMTARG